MKNTAIIVAAGASLRFGGDLPKQFKPVCGRPLLAWTIERFENADSIKDVIVVVAEEQLLYTSESVVDRFGFSKVSKIVIGGSTRPESVYNGLSSLPISTNYVAIHDGARPLTSPNDINSTVELAIKERAAILAAPVTDTIKRTADRFILSTVDRSSLYHAQTPQVFQYDLIMAAYKEYMGEGGDRDKGAASAERTEVTDDASLIEARGFKVAVIEPTAINLKVTTGKDLKVLEAILTLEMESADASRQRI